MVPALSVQIRYAWVSQRGYYPDALDKANQDSLTVKLNVGGSADTAFFGVFDGHGTSGTECARFARDRVRLTRVPPRTASYSPNSMSGILHDGNVSSTVRAFACDKVRLALVALICVCRLSLRLCLCASGFMLRLVSALRAE